MEHSRAARKPAKSYVVSLENRKRRGFGHQRPEEILNAARALFLEYGAENVTTRQIAARVGVSQTALYVYFKNKEEMLDRLVAGALSHLGAAIEAVSVGNEDPYEFLRLALREYMRFGLENPDEYRLVFMRGAVRRKADGVAASKPVRVGDALFNGLLHRIQLGVALGQFRCAKGERDMALAVWAAMHGLVSLRIANPDFDWPPVDAQIAAHVELILNGIAGARSAMKREDASAKAKAAAAL
jgi:AcrR family transcriptional regulator